jgi:hypothetical protein
MRFGRPSPDQAGGRRAWRGAILTSSWLGRGRTGWSPPSCSPGPASRCWFSRRTTRSAGRCGRSRRRYRDSGTIRSRPSIPFGVVGPVSNLSLGEHGLTWLHHPRPYGGATPAGRGVAQVRGDLEATAAIFERSQTGDGDGWRELDRWWAWAGEALLSLLFNPLGHVAPAVAGLSLLRNPRRLLEFAQLMAGSAEATATRFFEGEDARSWLSGSVLHGMTDRPAPGSDQASILPRWAYTPRDGDDCAGRRRHPTRWVYCGP